MNRTSRTKRTALSGLAAAALAAPLFLGSGMIYAQEAAPAPAIDEPAPTTPGAEPPAAGAPAGGAMAPAPDAAPAADAATPAPTEPAVAAPADAAAGDVQADAQAYVTMTLEAGAMSMAASELAMERAENPMVRQFAELEFNEQMAIAEVLSATGMSAPAMTPEQTAMMDEIGALEGAAFDAAYLEAQMMGHQDLLTAQQMLSGYSEASVEVITAKLAEQAILSHIAMLEWLETIMGETGDVAPAAPDEALAVDSEVAGPVVPAPATPAVPDAGAPAAPATPDAPAPVTPAEPAAPAGESTPAVPAPQ